MKTRSEIEVQTTPRSANRSALSERAAQGSSSQFNSLDFVLPWFGTRRSKVQILSPRPLLFNRLSRTPGLSSTLLVDKIVDRHFLSGSPEFRSIDTSVPGNVGAA